jgi:hypothetical protein
MAALADPSKTPQQLAALQAAARQRGVDLGIVRIASARTLKPPSTLPRPRAPKR